MLTLGSLFPTGETIGPRKGPRGVELFCHVGGSNQSESCHSSYPYNLVVQERASALPASSGFFTMVPYLRILADWSFCEED